MRVNHRESEIENHDVGLDQDLPRLLHRRGLLQLVAGASLITLAGCATAEVTSPTASGSEAVGSDTTPAAGELPEETAGPFPGDGSNGANVLTESGVIRSDITASFGNSTTTAAGIGLSITMTILDFAAGSAPMVGAAVYLWHCNIDGKYSLYSSGVENENYLRGVQETDGSGQVTFRSIFPAAYDGRWPHIHFEVYPGLAQATNSQNKIATSQMALPEDVASAVYATAGYEQSVTNLSRTSLDRDNVFSDGYDLQIPTVTGSVASGYALEFSCAV
ncbi:MAG: intradiol ring-cleavage dioxygenase [Propionibacteriaceae bacterium]